MNTLAQKCSKWHIPTMAFFGNKIFAFLHLSCGLVLPIQYIHLYRARDVDKAVEILQN